MPDVVRNGCELAHILEFVSNKPHLAKGKPLIHQMSFIYQNRKHFRKNNKKNFICKCFNIKRRNENRRPSSFTDQGFFRWPRKSWNYRYKQSITMSALVKALMLPKHYKPKR